MSCAHPRGRTHVVLVPGRPFTESQNGYQRKCRCTPSPIFFISRRDAHVLVSNNSLSLSLLRGNKEKREPESIATAAHEGPHDSNGCPLRMKPSSAIWRLASSTGSVRQQPLSALSIRDPPYRACPPFIRVVPGPIME